MKRRCVNQSIRSSGSALIIVFVCFCARAASAQWLELPHRPEPPVIGGDSFAAMLAMQLASEVEEMGVQVDGQAVRAAINLRRLAQAALLAQHDDPMVASAAVVAAMKLAHRRASIDESLHRIARSGESDQLAHRASTGGAAGAMPPDLVREFNTAVDRRLASESPLSAADLASLLAPLEDAIALASHGAPQKPMFDELVDRAAADEAVQTIVAEIAAYFERGWSFADLRPRILDWHALVRDALEYLIAVTDAVWLGEEGRAAGLERARVSFARFRDPHQREEGRALLGALLAEAKLLRAVTQLAQRDRARNPVDALSRAFVAVHRTFGADAESPDLHRLVERMDWLAVSAVRMERFRSLDRHETPLEMQRTRAKLVDAYGEAERSLIAHLEALATVPAGPMSDPSLTAIISEHRRLLRDLERLQSVSRLADAITLARPVSAGAFAERLHRLAMLLGDSVRRVDAATALDRIESEVSRYWPMPFEGELRTRADAADRATGGRHAELLEAIDLLREAWAGELSEEGPTLTRPAANRLELVHQLLVMMADLAELLRDPAQTGRLNGEDGWWLPTEVAQSEAGRVIPLLHDAVNAAINGEDQRLLEQVRHLRRRAAMARLIGRALKAGDLAEIDLADRVFICRYAVEAAHAAFRGRQAQAEAFQTFANRIAAVALNEL